MTKFIINRKIPKKVPALEALEKIITITDNSCGVLDVGSGQQEIHTSIFRDHGYNVDTVDFYEGATFRGDFNKLNIENKYDIVWASHCLEHQLNVNSFLTKIHKVTKLNGHSVITVPPLKHQIVGGHLSLWNAGLVLYNLVLAGFDCSNAKIKRYGYNISVIVQKTNIKVPFDNLVFDTPDLSLLKDFFPKQLMQEHKKYFFNGDMDLLNWDD